MLPAARSLRACLTPHPCRCTAATQGHVHCLGGAGHHYASLAVTSGSQSSTTAGQHPTSRLKSLLSRLHPLQIRGTIWSWLTRAHASTAAVRFPASLALMRATALLAAVSLPIACTTPAPVHCPLPCVTVPVGYAMMQPSVHSLSKVAAPAAPTHAHGQRSPPQIRALQVTAWASSSTATASCA